MVQHQRRRIGDVSDSDIVVTDEGADAATVYACRERGAGVLLT